MKLDNNSRFTVFKDAYTYLENNKKVIKIDKGIANKKDFDLTYSGDLDFKKYFRGNFAKINEIAKYYENIDLFLKNIDWDEIYSNLESSLKTIYGKITDLSGKDKSLFVVHMSPLEMIITGKTFEELGFKNVVYNFNRQPTINSASKTFEAFLYLVAYNKSPYFKQKNRDLILKLGLNAFLKEINDNYLIFDENNSINIYDYHDIDNYLKGQIGFSVPKNVYRLDKYPDKEFLVKKDIKQVVIFDSDKDLGELAEYYMDSIKKEKLGISFNTFAYKLVTSKKIGYYEEYLLGENKKYLVYKKDILDKTNKTYLGLNNYLDKSKNKFSLGTSKTSSKEERAFESRKKTIPLLVLFPVLIILFFSRDLSSASVTSSGATSGSSSSSGLSGYIGSLGGNSSSISTSSSTSSSLIKSFGGGGFSKGSSSS